MSANLLQIETETIQHIRAGLPLIVSCSTTIRDVLAQMREKRQGSALVVRQGVLCGIFTERDAMKLMASGEGFEASIDTVMTRDPVSVRDTDTVARAIQLMWQGGYRQLPILNDSDGPTGVVRVSHILHYVVEHVPQIVYNLPPSPHHSTQEREGA